MTTAHSLTIADLLLRDPEHPDVRRLLLLHYENVCRERRANSDRQRALDGEKALLEDVLRLKRKVDTRPCPVGE